MPNASLGHYQDPTYKNDALYQLLLDGGIGSRGAAVADAQERRQLEVVSRKFRLFQLEFQAAYQNEDRY